MDKEPHFALVQGSSRGLGRALVTRLLGRVGWQVFATCRSPERAEWLNELQRQTGERLVLLPLDLSDEGSIARAADAVASRTSRLHLLLNVAGVLHGPGFGPEKKLGQVDPEALRAVFEVNAFGPLLVAKHFHTLFRHEERSVFASVSARVGSISDNRLGGWYAYRGSKAAQNMFTKTVSIELGRVAPKSIVVGLHPGTVDTELSKPFQRNVPPGKLLSPADSAEALLGVIDRLRESDSGRVFDFRGELVPP
jgi:NAD(P)-dependent dehydrogenase (short-subunit alcohol dehydrogenase family)